MHSYRVFISYSHSDSALVERLAEVLNEAGLIAMYDKHLQPGAGFTGQIQDFIAYCHVFLVVLTGESASHPWLHQEVGCAVTLKKPVVPVIICDETCPLAAPQGIIGFTHAIKLGPDLGGASARLNPETFRGLVENTIEKTAFYECVEDNMERALLLARYAESVSSLGFYGKVRQCASLGTFSLPDRGKADPIWKVYFSGTPDNLTMFNCLQMERANLTRHAKRCGSRLILDPVDRLEDIFRKHGRKSVVARVRGLIAFLNDATVTDIEVAINDDESREKSVTIVGDWFSADAISSATRRVLEEGRFTRDSQVVRRQIADFDDRFGDLLGLSGWSRESSRVAAIAYLTEYLERLSGNAERNAAGAGGAG